MKQISIDIETYSSTNLNQTGVYRYADNDDFELLLFGYATDFGPIKVIDLTQGEKTPLQIIEALGDPNIIKSPFNAQFEQVCLSRIVGHRLTLAGWHCSRVWSATLGLPRCWYCFRVSSSENYGWKRILYPMQTNQI